MRQIVTNPLNIKTKQPFNDFWLSEDKKLNQSQYDNVKPNTWFKQLIYYSKQIMIAIPTPVCSPNGRIYFIQVGIYRRNTTYCREKFGEGVSISVSCFPVRSLLLLPHCKKCQNSQQTSAIISHTCSHLQSEKGNVAAICNCVSEIFRQNVGSCRFERKHTSKISLVHPFTTAAQHNQYCTHIYMQIAEKISLKRNLQKFPWHS